MHLKFIYSTGDAAGQNMTTTCTWHAVQWINRIFIQEKGIIPDQVGIEGNGASDKKISHYAMQQGRGVHVIAECLLLDKIIEKVFRVNAADFAKCFQQSGSLILLDGITISSCHVGMMINHSLPEK